MTFFLPEDGTGLSGANSYCDLAFAAAHFDARGQLVLWNGSPVLVAITDADAAADALEMIDHTFVTGDGPVRLVGDDLPDGLAEATDYWLVVVDGSVVQLAASYEDAVDEPPVLVDLEDAGTGDMLLSSPDFAAQRGWLVQGADYLEQMFGARFQGSPSLSTQGLHFPATGVFLIVDGWWTDITGVPDAIKRANAEYALIAKTGRLAQNAPEGLVTNESRSAGGISRSVTYAFSSGRPFYPAADRWMAPFLAPPRAVRS